MFLEKTLYSMTTTNPWTYQILSQNAHLMWFSPIPLSFQRNVLQKQHKQWNTSPKKELFCVQVKCNNMIPLLVLIHGCQLFLSQMHEISVLSWLGFPKTSQRLPKTSKHCRRIMSEDVPTTFENFQSYIKRDIFDVVVTWVSGFLFFSFFSWE